MAGEDFLSGLNFINTDFATALSSDGGFTMNTAEMESLLARAHGTLGIIDDQRRVTRNRAHVDPPGDDMASVGITNKYSQAGQGYVDFLNIQHNRYKSLINKLNQALGRTAETDQANADITKQAGQEGKY